MKRDHENLCSYNPKNANKSSGSVAVAGVKRPRTRSPESDNSLKRGEDRWPRTTGMESDVFPVVVQAICPSYNVPAVLNSFQDAVLVRLRNYRNDNEC